MLRWLIFLIAGADNGSCVDPDGDRGAGLDPNGG
jgi:hypothetical protein